MRFLYTMTMILIFTYQANALDFTCPDTTWVADVELRGGQIMADYNSTYSSSGEKVYYEVLFWDTKTGESRLYRFKEDRFLAYDDDVQLPARPLDNIEGEVRVLYKSIDIENTGTLVFDVLFWDTATGFSRLYHFDYDEMKFVLYPEEFQLPQKPLTSTNREEGIVMFDYSIVYIPTTEKVYYDVLVWDTKTRASLLYYKTENTDSFKIYKTHTQFPFNPLEGMLVEGDMMASYSVVYVPSQDKTYYEVLFWDTKTGASILYYYDYEQERFLPYNKVYGIHDARPFTEALFLKNEGRSKNDKVFHSYNGSAQLPTRPLDTLVVEGDIMAIYSAIHITGDTYYEVLFWDTKTGASRFYYYSYPNKKFKLYSSNVQLPIPDFVNSESRIMIDYEPVYLTHSEKTLYEILFWDMNTGESVLYNYDFTDKEFQRYKQSSQLPARPLN